MNRETRKRTHDGLARHALAATIAILFLGSGAVRADDAASLAELKARLEQSMKLIESLSARIEQLENRLKQTESGAAADESGRLAAVEKDLAQLTESKAMAAAETGTPLHGFGHVGFVRSSKNGERIAGQTGRGFSGGLLDFYLMPQLGDKSRALIELAFEFGSEGALSAELERIQFGYAFSDKFTGWAGRFHTPYGYWNTAFHHGAQIQAALLRPRFIDFEEAGGVLPAHLVGAWATGSRQVGEGKLSYDLYLGNGSGIRVDNSVNASGTANPRGTLSINNFRDSNGNTMFGGNLGYRFDAGLMLGVHGFTERVNVINTAAAPHALLGEVGVSMAGFYGVYDASDWENIAEYYRFNNDDSTGASGAHSSWLGFVQAGRTFGDAWTPYLRLEKAVLDQMDPYFRWQNYGVSYSREALGLRYNLNDKSALKLEVNHTNERDGVVNRYNEARLQYSIRF